MRLFFAVLLALCLLPCAARAGEPWLVVSDIHLNPFDTDAAPSSYHSDSNWALFNSTLDEMHRVDPEPPVIVISGDFLAHEWSAKVRAAGLPSPAQAAESAMQRMASAFDRRFPHSQFVIVLGNNDDPCGDYRAAPGTPYMAKLARIWAPLVNRNNAAPDFARDFSQAGAYTARLPFASLQAIAIDDVYWSFVYRGCGGRGVRDPSRLQLQWMEKASEFAGRSVPVMHIPPGVDPSSTLLTHRFFTVPFLANAWNAAFVRVAGAQRARIPFVIAGHVHRSDFRLIANVPILIAPAVSPVYDTNPGFLRIEVAPDGTLRDSQQYAYDEDSETWGELADFDAVFHTHALTYAELSAAHDRLAHDPALRDRWAAIQMNGARYRPIVLGWRAFWCAQTFFGTSYAACTGSQRRAAVLPAAAGVVATAVLFGLTLLGLRLARHRRAH